MLYNKLTVELCLHVAAFCIYTKLSLFIFTVHVCKLLFAIVTMIFCSRYGVICVRLLLSELCLFFDVCAYMCPVLLWP